jgi:Crinkler effector protein N-terminal domain
MMLFCWVFGDARPFPVKINRDKTVGELKEAIVAKDPNRFRDIVPHSLALWKKIICEGDKSLQPSGLKEEDELYATWKVGKHFEEAPPEERIHIFIGLRITLSLNKYWQSSQGRTST